MANAGVSWTDGEAGFSSLERTTIRPTCEVVGIGVGYTGQGMKTIVPATGNVKVTFRLVPDQRPAHIASRFEPWPRPRSPEGPVVALSPAGPAAAPPPTH